jgi:hypothetical protein
MRHQVNSMKHNFLTIISAPPARPLGTPARQCPRGWPSPSPTPCDSPHHGAARRRLLRPTTVQGKGVRLLRATLGLVGKVVTKSINNHNANNDLNTTMTQARSMCLLPGRRTMPEERLDDIAVAACPREKRNSPSAANVCFGGAREADDEDALFVSQKNTTMRLTLRSAHPVPRSEAVTTCRHSERPSAGTQGGGSIG